MLSAHPNMNNLASYFSNAYLCWTFSTFSHSYKMHACCSWQPNIWVTKTKYSLIKITFRKRTFEYSAYSFHHYRNPICYFEEHPCCPCARGRSICLQLFSALAILENQRCLERQTLSCGEWHHVLCPFDIQKKGDVLKFEVSPICRSCMVLYSYPRQGLGPWTLILHVSQN